MWIAFTFLAAMMQAWRNALQSQLSHHVNVVGVTLARFIIAGPIAAVYLWSLQQFVDTAPMQFNPHFAKFVLLAALMQIIATALMVKLFSLKNYAIGAGLAKSEAMVAAILGMVFFGTQLTPLGWVGVCVGGVAVLILSGIKSHQGLSVTTVLIGLASGSAFALTSLSVREASLQLHGPFALRAAWVLLCVIALQTCLLMLYLCITDRATLKALWHKRKLTVAISVTSCIGSIGWFSAMAIESVPLVKTLGQVEVFFMLLISRYWLKQGTSKSDMLGLLLIAIAAILVMWS
ncbi:multidrug transporter [Shewanella intestini]|uniref:Multidrug transporter n=1 Tax=Shewanella intestini TaxID=2017544 RepID=A0ABS5I623_9GAMM|nr:MULTISPECIES: multidrug transporter [Shewanella]MBR9729474.1 multidrug transporter [Shewanella intestini]MRG35065.1 multidrug transporter [Shewanella sp. XMDDZSB0408]